MNVLLLVGMAVLALLAVALVAFFGVRQRAQRRTRLDVNRELYQQRQQELKQEYADGLLSEKAFQAALRELDKRFVNENAELEQLEEHAIGRGIWLPAVFIVIFAAVGYALFGSWEQQRFADQARQQLPELAQQVLNNQQAAPTEEELKLFALGLRQRLQQDGGDGLTWMLYARATTALQRYEQALEAYGHAYQLEPERPGILLGYAQLLINLGGAEQLQRAARLLSELLALEPRNIDALSLTGAVAYQRGDWQQAVEAWRLLSRVMSADDPRYVAVQEALADARAQLEATQQQLRVRVELADALRAQLPEDATLFVFVKAVDGAPMPAAVVRQPVNDFPVEVVLSDAQAMLPDYKMSQLNQWLVEARISTDDRIEIAAGDLGAEAKIVTPAPDAEVTLTISLQLTPN
ncbi:c-type cytochrome biogenesis protein CcmI [Pseudidiomarina insulisalsae]|uniref:C-type cytochrome biogenesis protein CcmI n=1 Tax=Pseudidiomarina insulisalsae TaxID=575789 RepID=A0A432YLI9_9GAMM|nr:c-type cytochrome biogenesis protein CcmI [Pseudidiomarina insulisalsae]RUO61851.1 c-type cytochrome biogenesis protein CcmI [Pseudidiomarina insulisalsae]